MYFNTWALKKPTKVMLFLKAYNISLFFCQWSSPILKDHICMQTNVIWIFKMNFLIYLYIQTMSCVVFCSSSCCLFVFPFSCSFILISFPCSPYYSLVVDKPKEELGNYIAKSFINTVFSSILLIILRFNLLRIVRVRNRFSVLLESYGFQLFKCIKCYAAFI